MEGLGFFYDVSLGFAPVNMSGQANLGKRVNLKNSEAVSFWFIKGVGTGGQDPVLTLNAQNARTGGTSQALAGLTRWYKKSAVAMDGTETWVLTSQVAASTITLTGEAANQGIYMIPVNATALPAGFNYVSLDVANVGAGAQTGTIVSVLHGLQVQRKPASLIAGLT